MEHTTTTQEAPMTTKDQLAKGTKVRLSASFISGQNARDAAEADAMGWSQMPTMTTDMLFSVTDLMTRKTYNRPDRVGVTRPDRPGIAYGVDLADIVEVVER